MANKTELNLPHEAHPVISRDNALANGLKRYFTGKPCPRGHVCERQTSNRACLMCSFEAIKIWRAANKDERVKYDAVYRVINREKIKVARKAYAEKNKEHIAIKRAEWKERNKGHYTQASKVWRAANPEKSRCIVRTRRARKRNAEGQHTAADVQRIFSAQRGRCAHCLAAIKAGYHVDHIQPISRGGSNWPRNLQLLCAPCNLRKNAADPIDFARREGKLL